MRPARLMSSVRAWLIAARLSGSRGRSRCKDMVIWKIADRRPTPIRTSSRRAFWRPCAAPASRLEKLARYHLGNKIRSRSRRYNISASMTVRAKDTNLERRIMISQQAITHGVDVQSANSMEPVQVVAADQIAPVKYDWGSIKWVSDMNVTPGSQQSIGYAYVLPGKTNPEHRHMSCQEVIYMLAS